MPGHCVCVRMILFCSLSQMKDFRCNEANQEINKVNYLSLKWIKEMNADGYGNVEL